MPLAIFTENTKFEKPQITILLWWLAANL